MNPGAATERTRCSGCCPESAISCPARGPPRKAAPTRESGGKMPALRNGREKQIGDVKSPLQGETRGRDKDEEVDGQPRPYIG
jgi:hypothetical protein